MKTNDPYFQAFDMVIGCDSKTFSPKKKFPITKLESLVLAAIPIATTVAAYEASNALAYCFAGLQWAFYVYAHIAVYMSERIGDQL